MKKNWYVIALVALLLLAAVPSFAQNLQIRATCADTAGTGYITAGSDFTVVIELFNAYGDFGGGSVPLTVYSPDGATLSQRNVAGKPVVDFRTSPSAYYTDSCIESINGWDGIFNLLNDYYGFSWDGSLPDTMNWSGITMGAFGVDADYVGRFQFNFTAGMTDGDICVDSCSLPGAAQFDWLWVDPGATFNGPYCWEVRVVEGVEEIEGDNLLPIEFGLAQNYPNPFNPETIIKFDIKHRTDVNISIFNILGQKVTTLADSEFEAGHYQATWNGTDDNGKSVSSGMYFYRLEADEFTDTKKMIMLK